MPSWLAIFDDPPRPACRHPRCELAAGQEHTSQGDLDDPVEITGADLRERCLVQHAGAVDQDINASRALGQCADRLLAAQVHERSRDRDTGFAAFCCHCGQAVHGVIGDDERRASQGESPRDRAADPTCRTHDQGTLSIQHVHALAACSSPTKIVVSSDAPTSTLGLLTASRISRSTATLDMTYACSGVNPRSWTR